MRGTQKGVDDVLKGCAVTSESANTPRGAIRECASLRNGHKSALDVDRNSDDVTFGVIFLERQIYTIISPEDKKIGYNSFMGDELKYHVCA